MWQRRLAWVGLALVAASCGVSSSKAAPKRDIASVPPELRRVFDQLVAEIRAENVEGIEALCLPRSVVVEKAPRSSVAPTHGDDINLPFWRQWGSVAGRIESLDQPALDVVVLGSPMSSFWFVHTARDGWKLYAYRDKPRE
jgi:hypothetical protein